MIAFLGIGHLGVNFVKSLLRNGMAVNVWNRTFLKAQAMETFGARPFSSITDSVIGIKRIHITLKDDDSVDEVLSLAAPAIEPGTIIIDHTTTSKEGAITRTHFWKEKRITYLHAPTFMSPENALNCTGSILVSGNQEIITKWTPELQKMTGTVINCGSETGKAAALKLVRNLYVIGMNGILFEALTLGKVLGINSHDVAGLFKNWNPAAVLPKRIENIANDNFDKVDFELEMAKKDVRLMLNATEGELKMMHEMATTMDEYINLGYAKSDWTILAKGEISGK